MGGFPTKNFKKIALGIYYNISDMVSGEAFETAVKNNAVNDFFGAYTRSKSQEYHIMYEALKSGNTEKYETAYKNAIKGGGKASEIYSGIKSQIKKSVEIDSKDFNKLSEEDQSKVRGNIAGAETNELYGDTDTYDELYKLYRTNRIKYKSVCEDLIKQGKSATTINDGFTAAKIKYLSKDKVDLTDYYIAKILTGKSYADQDKNGRVTKAEMCAAIDKMEIDSQTKAILKRII